MARPNSGAALPTLTRPAVVDATRLRSYMACARRFLYEHVYGFAQAEFAVDLEFGRALHAGFEAMDKAAIGRGDGYAEPDAVTAAISAAWAASADWPLRLEPPKDRATLLRVFPYYAEQYGSDSLSVVRLIDGRPAVEIPFSAELGGGVTLVCRPDSIVQFEPGLVLIRERKSTKSSPGIGYDSRWNPDIQIAIQTIVGAGLIDDPAFSFDGVLLESIHVSKGERAAPVRFSRAFCHRTEANIEEDLAEVKEIAESLMRRIDATDMGAETAANAWSWPKNLASCALCRFKAVCAAPPAERPALLTRDFVQRPEPWDPCHA